MSVVNRPYQIHIMGSFAAAGNVHWHATENLVWGDGEEGLFLTFKLYADLKLRDALKPIKRGIEHNNISWIQEHNGHWFIDLDRLFPQFRGLHPHKWLTGVVKPEIEVETKKIATKQTHVQFVITRKEVDKSMPKKIFLSHKGIDKPIVRDYFYALKYTGFDPWLDEDAMVAGVPLERALLEGMKESCAAVFFVTPKYDDANFLASEINYAMSQKRERGDRFSIITLIT